MTQWAKAAQVGAITLLVNLEEGLGFEPRQAVKPDELATRYN